MFKLKVTVLMDFFLPNVCNQEITKKRLWEWNLILKKAVKSSIAIFKNKNRELNEKIRTSLQNLTI